MYKCGFWDAKFNDFHHKITIFCQLINMFSVLFLYSDMVRLSILRNSVVITFYYRFVRFLQKVFCFSILLFRP